MLAPDRQRFPTRHGMIVRLAHVILVTSPRADEMVEAVATDKCGFLRLVAVEAVVLFDLACQACFAIADPRLASTITDVRFVFTSDALFVVPAIASVRFIVPGLDTLLTDAYKAFLAGKRYFVFRVRLSTMGTDEPQIVFASMHLVVAEPDALFTDTDEAFLAGERHLVSGVPFTTVSAD
jgi:hypothetical protein